MELYKDEATYILNRWLSIASDDDAYILQLIDARECGSTVPAWRRRVLSRWGI